MSESSREAFDAWWDDPATQRGFHCGHYGDRDIAQAAWHQAQAVASSPEAAGAPLSGFTTIPVGTLLMHDHAFCRWPDCANPEDADPATVFEVKELREGGTIELTAPGFGAKGAYRNGSILVKRGHWLEAWKTSPAASGLSADARSNDPTTGGLKERPEPALTALHEWLKDCSRPDDDPWDSGYAAAKNTARDLVRAALSHRSTEEPARQPLPHPGSPVASAMLDSLLAEYDWPANPKNAARAGWEAAQRFLSMASPPASPSVAEEPKAP